MQQSTVISVYVTIVLQKIGAWPSRESDFDINVIRRHVSFLRSWPSIPCVNFDRLPFAVSESKRRLQEGICECHWTWDLLRLHRQEEASGK